MGWAAENANVKKNVEAARRFYSEVSRSNRLALDRRGQERKRPLAVNAERHSGITMGIVRKRREHVLSWMYCNLDGRGRMYIACCLYLV